LNLIWIAKPESNSPTLAIWPNQRF